MVSWLALVVMVVAMSRCTTTRPLHPIAEESQAGVRPLPPATHESFRRAPSCRALPPLQGSPVGAPLHWVHLQGRASYAIDRGRPLATEFGMAVHLARGPMDPVMTMGPELP